MSSAGKMQPVRITELMGHPRSARKEPASERKVIEPVRIKQLLEASKSCSRTTDRSSRPTFLIPVKGVRRKLYDRSPSPKVPRASTNPPKARASTLSRASILPRKILPNPPGASRPSVYPVKPSPKLQQYQPSPRAPVPKVRKTKNGRKSFLLPPNSIVKQHIEKVGLDKTVVELPREKASQLSRPTVIISTESVRENLQTEQVENLNDTFTKDDTEANELERSLENKENIPPVKVNTVKPLVENNSLKLDSVSVELVQDAVKRLEKMEADIEEIKSTQSCILRIAEDMRKFLQVRSNQKNGRVSDTVDKENNRAKGAAKPPSTERRRSARLASKQQNSGDSFSQLEQELNIARDAQANKVTPGKKTPVRDQILRNKNKSERALREYLAIKASMSYLETPEAGKLKSSHDNEINTPSGLKSLRRSISRKVFDEIQDLYSDDDEFNQVSDV